MKPGKVEFFSLLLQKT